MDPIHYVTSSYFTDYSGIDVIDVIFYTRLDKSSKEVFPSQREVPFWDWFTQGEIDKDPRSPPWLKLYLEKLRLSTIKVRDVHVF